MRIATPPSVSVEWALTLFRASQSAFAAISSLRQAVCPFIAETCIGPFSACRV